MARIALSLRDFQDALVNYFEIEHEVSPESNLTRDLQLDSLQLYELLELLEDVAGFPVPADVLDSISTVGTAYDAYCFYIDQRNADVPTSNVDRSRPVHLNDR